MIWAAHHSRYLVARLSRYPDEKLPLSYFYLNRVIYYFGPFCCSLQLLNIVKCAPLLYFPIRTAPVYPKDFKYYVTAPARSTVLPVAHTIG